jgi:hypothetical protein
MPAKSEKQRRFMAMCSHSPGKARGKCPPKKVAHEFSMKPAGGYRKKKNGVPFPRRNSAGYY